MAERLPQRRNAPLGDPFWRLPSADQPPQQHRSPPAPHADWLGGADFQTWDPIKRAALTRRRPESARSAAPRAGWFGDGYWQASPLVASRPVQPIPYKQPPPRPSPQRVDVSHGSYRPASASSAARVAASARLVGGRPARWMRPPAKSPLSQQDAYSLLLSYTNERAEEARKAASVRVAAKRTAQRLHEQQELERHRLAWREREMVQQTRLAGTFGLPLEVVSAIMNERSTAKSVIGTLQRAD